MLTVGQITKAHRDMLRAGREDPARCALLVEAARSAETTLPADEQPAAQRTWHTMRLRTEAASDATEDESSSQRMMALQALVGDGSLVLHLVKTDNNPSANVCIGRSKRNDVIIDHDTVSSVHAWVDLDGAFPILLDRHSANGTFVNGSKLKPDVPTPLSSGDCVRFGKRVFYFLDRKRVSYFLELRIAKSSTKTQ